MNYSSSPGGATVAANQNIEDAFTSMLRTDYIPLADTDKLNLLADYYVDYMGYMKDIVGPTDQLIVGRRGTGKTTLLYRALVECIRSWGETATAARPRTLGVYLDLEKCQSLSSTMTADFASFEFAFIAELCDAIKEELLRSWPELAAEPSLIDRLFRNGQTKKAAAVNSELDRLVEIITSGLPRFVNKSGVVDKKIVITQSSSGKAGLSGSAGPAPKISAELGSEEASSVSSEANRHENVTYRLSVADLLRVINDLRKAADIPYFLIFVDEFSSLHIDLQQRFSTLLKKILGNHAGVYVKLCAITDNYRLGSSIILQRDLFELSLDLDAFVERSGSLTSAMDQLSQLTELIVEQRIKAYTNGSADRVFDSPSDAYNELTLSAMGVPRTIGIVLKQAWSRGSNSSRHRIRRTDLEYGIRYASKAYLNQMTGAARDGVAIPAHIPEIWDSLLDRASRERRKTSDSSAASHFMVLPKNEERLRFLNMFFLVHLLEKGRTTKKESLSRSLYSFDYGITQENNLGWGNDKNVIRQQRFTYDTTLQEFDRYYEVHETASFRCVECKKIYPESSLMLNGSRLKFCPEDRGDLEAIAGPQKESSYTEEEIKIIGAIRSASREDELMARQVADDVGCYVQKVAKFGERLERDSLIRRERPANSSRNYYFDVDKQ